EEPPHETRDRLTAGQHSLSWNCSSSLLSLAFWWACCCQRCSGRGMPPTVDGPSSVETFYPMGPGMAGPSVGTGCSSKVIHDVRFPLLSLLSSPFFSHLYRPICTSHTRAVPSWLPVRAVLPSGLKHTLVSRCVCPLRVASSWPVSASHSRAIKRGYDQNP